MTPSQTDTSPQPPPGADAPASRAPAAHLRRRLGLRLKATIIVLLLLGVTLSAADTTAIVSMREQSMREHRRSTIATAAGLALASQVAMFSGDTKELERLAATQLEDQQCSFVALVNAHGQILAKATRDEPAWEYYRQRHEARSEGLIEGEIPSLRCMIASSPIVAMGSSGEDVGLLDNPARSKAPVGKGEPTGLAIIGMSTSELHAAIYQQTGELTLAFALVALCSTPVVWFVVGGWTRRLDRLVLASRRIAEGDLESVLVDSKLDEVGQLARAYEDMRSCLKLRDEQMQNLNSTLQQRVDEQTHRLRDRAELLESAVRQAEAANRAKSDFLANMSHEIRTPMTAILGYADLLQDPEQSVEERVNCVTTIRRSGDHLMSILNDILDLSKIEAGRFVVQKEKTDAIQVIAEVVSLMRPRAAAAGLFLGVCFEGELPATVVSDSVRLRQIIMNIVGNAVKFTQAGGVSLVCDIIHEDGRTLLRTRITDTGIGMTPDQIGLLFRPFSQADETMSRRFGGTGLGLAISKHLAELLGGAIEVQSTHGQGSTFTVTVDTGPLDGIRMILNPTEAMLLDRKARPIAQVAHRLPGRILLAEDGPDNQRLISFHLKKAGAQVTVAANGQLAVNEVLRATAAGEHYSLILMDMQMPEMDGYAATRALRSSGYSLPIIALTAHAMSGDAQRCLDAGCNAYASKPIDRDQLLALCAKWFAPAPTATAATG